MRKNSSMLIANVWKNWVKVSQAAGHYKQNTRSFSTAKNEFWMRHSWRQMKMHTRWMLIIEQSESK